MDPGIYYTLITKDSLHRAASLLNYIEKNILPHTRYLCNIQFLNKYPSKPALINRYLVLSIKRVGEVKLYTSIGNPGRNNAVADQGSIERFIRIFFKIVYDKCQELQGKESTHLLFKLRDFLRTFLVLSTNFDNSKSINHSNNIQNHEDQLQREETVGEFRSNRNGTPIRYSGYKLTVAIGHLSNAKRTCKV